MEKKLGGEPGLRKKYAGMKVLVMGLGLNGGGLESARYLAGQGAEVSVTDLRDEQVLSPSIEKLRGLPIRYVLGRHDMDDFKKADMVIKNPGVRPDSPFLKAAKLIETDISIFLADSPARLSALTGSKGKSGTAAALHWVLNRLRGEGRLSGSAYLGGNITVSPLSFLDRLEADDDVVLELSSWQLGDLAGRTRNSGTAFEEALLKPRAAVLTSIMPDHLDRYVSMDAYVEDKKIIYRGQDRRDCTVAAYDEWGRIFLEETAGRPLAYSGRPLPEGISGGWIEDKSGTGLARSAGTGLVEVVPEKLLVPGPHQKRNLLAAALALLDLGLEAEAIRDALGSFPGIEHRLEYFHESRGILFYNDSAATIPEAAAAALRSFERPVVLVTGGMDKNLDFTPLAEAAAEAKALVLLEGSGSRKLMELLDRAALPYRGPFDSLDAALLSALDAAEKGDTLILSPGCTSFGMFLNEFDRGKRWKEAVLRLA